jgi:hypothetical protein
LAVSPPVVELKARPLAPPMAKLVATTVASETGSLKLRSSASREPLPLRSAVSRVRIVGAVVSLLVNGTTVVSAALLARS